MRLRRGVFVAACAVLAVSPARGQQVSDLRARHREGQTILMWQEPGPPATQESLTVKEYRALAAAAKAKKVRFRVYRSPRPIVLVDGLTPVGEVPQMTCWNIDYYGSPNDDQQALRYVVEEGAPPVVSGTGIYAHNPAEAGEAYYAVTVVVDGKEHATLNDRNALETPVRETVGPGPFILQRTVRPKDFMFIDGPTLHYYVRWESPPNCSVENRPFDYLVAVPPKLATPAPVGINLHCWGGSLNGGYGWWYNAEKGAIMIASNQIPYDWWTGYHERIFTGARLESADDWRAGVVRPYTQTRMLSFLDWVGTKWEIDPARVFTAGSSMGGSGSLMFAIRHPERIAWSISWVGVHIPLKSPTFKGSYEQSYGRPEYAVRFEDGTPVWDYFDDAWYLRRYVQRDVGFLTFSNGKNDGGIGWPQAVEFLRALQETRRPHLFVWGQSGHGQRAAMPKDGGERVNPIDIRLDQSLPAFTGCSLDGDPGNGDLEDGDPTGQVNMFLYWETGDVVDTTDAWEMTVGLTRKAPKDGCTVDLTPRRCQVFKAKPGEKFSWTNTSGGGKVQSGETTADEVGLVTLKKVAVTKAANRIRISR